MNFEELKLNVSHLDVSSIGIKNVTLNHTNINFDDNIITFAALYFIVILVQFIVICITCCKIICFIHSRNRRINV